ncbi:SapC family protein [Aestuariibacter sp. A3R04]|uniref:SapC family protein n=1 Tax=Aestuariibacter sp. A3R04 TaxID=2841571 RepID=UPI001C09C1DE|nr:SapC family protein [Aestuariibacter sp. A3R04]MBU3021256.1 SapC family protein [Aestuariibacter sp. A3R04]
MEPFEHLSNKAHQHLKICTDYTGHSLFNESTFPVLINEFQELQREYPIALFRSAQTGRLSIHALTAFEEGVNSFIYDNKWRAQYIPLFVYCHPFSVTLSESGTASLLVNPSHPAFEGGTEPLLHADGTLTTFTQSIMAALEKIHHGQRETADFIKFLEEHNLVREIAIEFANQHTETVKKSGMLTVETRAFLSLPQDVQMEAVKKGFYAAMVLIEASLHGMRTLFNRNA